VGVGTVGVGVLVTMGVSVLPPHRHLLQHHRSRHQYRQRQLHPAGLLVLVAGGAWLDCGCEGGGGDSGCVGAEGMPSGPDAGVGVRRCVIVLSPLERRTSIASNALYILTSYGGVSARVA
jgi:hypothetical protein